ncbi:RHS repeat-associated protein [Burkholderia ambifaria]|nr:RHS repeat-associated core domain-containing protein [Burkholderia ambifaria]MDR6501908.1 RHS repeat-associated protein [Burkholderia ambifaria]
MSEFETRLTRASAPAESHSTSPESKADTACDSLLGTVKSTFDPFKETFSSEGGTPHHVSEAVNSLASLQGMPSQLLNTGIAQIPLLDKMPGMPAATIGVPHLGTPHAHSHPPSSGFPLPSVGATIGSGCLSVLIGGIPAARVLDIGIAPTCGGITPYFDIQTGSSNTFIGGMRAARMGIDMTRHCNPMGHVGKSSGEAASAAEKSEEVASEAAQVTGRAKALGLAGKAWSVGNAAVGPASGVATAADDASQGEIAAAAMMAAQTAADLAFMMLSNLMGKDPGIEPSMGTLLAGDPTVLIGGFPLPDSQMMWHGIRHGLGKKVTARRADRRKEAAPCRDGHPVDVVRGTAENEFIDYATKIALAFKWERYYCSGWSDQDGPLGFGFRHCFQHELRLLRTRAIYVDALNREYPIHRNAADRYEDIFAGYELMQHDERRFVLRHGRLGDMTFERRNEADRTAKLVRHVRDGVESALEYACNGALARIAQEECRGLRRQLIDFRYDDSDHIVELYLTDPQGEMQRIAHYRYDTAGCLVEFTDPLGAMTSHEYDDRRRMIRETDANGYSFSYRYDSQDRCVESGGQDGLWHVVLDYQPGRTVVTRADGGKWMFLYDEARTVTHIVDPYGGAIERVIGDDGRILREIDSGGRVIHWLYDERGGNTGRLDRWGNRWPTREEAPVLPNPLAHTIPGTPLGLQWGGVKGAERADTILLPPEIVKIAASLFPPPAFAPTEQHDARGQVIARTDGYGRAERLRLDAAGNLTRLCDRDGRNYCYNIASWNLRESETDPLGNTVRYRFSPKQEITAIVDANGNESAYTYDYKSRVTSVTRHGTIRETYAYDVGDRLIEKRDGAGNTLLRFEVGKNGLQNTRYLTSGETHTYEYDSRGNFTKASTDKFDVTLTYDAHGRRTGDKRDGRGIEHSFTGRRLQSTSYFGRFVVRYETDPAGNVVIHTPDGGVHRLQRAADDTVLLRLGNRTNVLYGFDADGRCTGRLTWPEGCTTGIRSVEYRYSAVGELRRVIDSTGGITEYQYDAAHRLVGESRDGWTVRRFEYDAGGNLLSTPTCQWMHYTEGNRLSSTACGAFRYNSRNHLAEQVGESNHRTIYHYNSMDLLVQVKWTDRDDVWTADYDGLCRRVCKATNGMQTDFYWDGDRLAAEKGPDERLRIYLYVNEDAFLPFMFIDYPNEDASPESGRAYFVFCNQAGLPEWIENLGGREVWRSLSTDPYGLVDVAQAQGERVNYNLRWPGHYFDPETALHYNRFRSYNPSLGRYLQSDPAGQSGGINLYAYTANPLTFVDVMGLKCPHGKTETECPDCGRINEDPEVVRLTDEKAQWKKWQAEILAEHGNLEPTNLESQDYHAIKKSIIPDVEKEIEEARKAADRRPLVDKYAEKVNSNKPWKWEDFSDSLTEGEKSKIKQQAIDDGLVPIIPYKPKLNDDGSVMLDEQGNMIPSRYPDFSKVLYPDGTERSVIDTHVIVPKDRWKQGDTAQFNWANSQRGGEKEGYMWHHSELDGRMERVPFGLHGMISHDGGRSPGHWAEGKR